MVRELIVAAALAAVAGACGNGDGAEYESTPENTPENTEAAAELWTQIDDLDAAVAQWEAATDLGEARAAAEEARNLVVGPDGPNFGDGDGDGSLAGDDLERGLLPGADGEAGAATLVVWPCLEADVLGGSWDDAAERWDILAEAIDAWSPSNNPFPTLPSHPQRVVGWATLTLETDDLDEAHEYAGHARLHVDVTTDAAERCVPR